jgi:hypothetical protein
MPGHPSGKGARYLYEPPLPISDDVVAEEVNPTAISA